MAALVCVDDFEILAKSKLPKMVYDYYRSGADSEQSLRRNVNAFKKLLIRPRMLTDVSQIDTSVTLFSGDNLQGIRLNFPIGIAPTAFHRLADNDGEVATARGAAKAETLMIASTIANTSLESIAEAAPDGLRWFQLYVYKDRDVTLKLVERAKMANYKALVVTVDTPVLGMRRGDLRNAFALPNHLKFGNFSDTEEMGRMKKVVNSGHSGFGDYANSLFDSSLQWTDIAWLVRVSRLPVIVKGVLTPRDALLAYQHGARGVIVSNHGARQLDCVPATIEALPEISEALAGRCDLYLDGGIRCGTDIFKAVALGAKAVFLGRPIIWALAARGEKGVTDILHLLQCEFASAMKLAGVRSIEEIGTDMVVHESNYYYKKYSKL